MTYFDKFKEMDYVKISDSRPLELLWATPSEEKMGGARTLIRDVYKKTLNKFFSNKINQTFWQMGIESLNKKEYDLILVAENLFVKDEIDKYCFKFRFNEIRNWNKDVSSLFIYSSSEYEERFFDNYGKDIFDDRISSLSLFNFIYKILDKDVII